MGGLRISCGESLGDQFFFLLFGQLLLVLVVVQSRCVLNNVTTYLVDEVVIGVVLTLVFVEIFGDLLPGRASLAFLSLLEFGLLTPVLRGWPSGALGII